MHHADVSLLQAAARVGVIQFPAERQHSGEEKHSLLSHTIKNCCTFFFSAFHTWLRSGGQLMSRDKLHSEGSALKTALTGILTQHTCFSCSLWITQMQTSSCLALLGCTALFYRPCRLDSLSKKQSDEICLYWLLCGLRLTLCGGTLNSDGRHTDLSVVFSRTWPNLNSEHMWIFFITGRI